ncbi:hypothetical protein E2320_000177, partial [Naja naja]
MECHWHRALSCRHVVDTGTGPTSTFPKKIKTLLSAAVSVSISTPSRRRFPAGKFEPSGAFSTKLFQQLATSEGTPSQPSHRTGPGDRIPAGTDLLCPGRISTDPARDKRVVKGVSEFSRQLLKA